MGNPVGLSLQAEVAVRETSSLLSSIDRRTTNVSQAVDYVLSISNSRKGADARFEAGENG
jgi:hypothetical protein